MQILVTRSRTRRAFLAAGLAALALTAWPAAAQSSTSGPATEPSRALQRASDAVIGVMVQAVPDATSARTLGLQRQGSGVVIGSEGLVLTIGYLILEADQVQLVTDDGRRIPARVAAFDVATGFGLLQALAPLRLDAVPLGRSAALEQNEPLVVVSGGEAGSVSVARLVSRRAFSGYWEYHIEDALFTSPPRRDHSGAALFNGRGELVGIGSLFVADALGPQVPGMAAMAGNMFVPVDLLTPILAELQQSGASRASTRAWLGVNCVEHNGQLRVLRVSEDSPADVAGLRVGDRILGIDGVQVNRLEQLWKTLWSGTSSEREVTLDIQRDGAPQKVKVFAVDRAKVFRRAEGV